MFNYFLLKNTSRHFVSGICSLLIAILLFYSSKKKVQFLFKNRWDISLNHVLILFPILFGVCHIG